MISNSVPSRRQLSGGGDYSPLRVAGIDAQNGILNGCFAVVVRALRMLARKLIEQISMANASQCEVSSAHARFTVAVPMPKFSAVTRILAPCSSRQALMTA